MKFLKPAGTSRGVLTEKDSWFIRLSRTGNTSVYGIGECSLIPGLSHDNSDNFDRKLNEFCMGINKGQPVDQHLRGYPAIQFGFEMALLDLVSGGKKILFPSEFTAGKSGLPINGLIWMDNREKMVEQITAKISQGFTILKMKVGALNFNEELKILQSVRDAYGPTDLEVRLDANGAWGRDEAIEKLKQLSEYSIHSVEQPIPAGRITEMAEVCSASPVPVALDEELIGVADSETGEKILHRIKPAYIIIKPTLLGGFRASEEWIRLAEKTKTGWWITSALESNIGLNAIAQWTATQGTKMPQGLGTGMLYANNFPSPLKIKGDKLYHEPGDHWDHSILKF